jgi:hypothetical protein
MRTELPLDALALALRQRDVQGGRLVHHSQAIDYDQHSIPTAPA